MLSLFIRAMRIRSFGPCVSNWLLEPKLSPLMRLPSKKGLLALWKLTSSLKALTCASLSILESRLINLKFPQNQKGHQLREGGRVIDLPFISGEGRLSYDLCVLHWFYLIVVPCM